MVLRRAFERAGDGFANQGRETFLREGDRHHIPFGIVVDLPQKVDRLQAQDPGEGLEVVEADLRPAPEDIAEGSVSPGELGLDGAQGLAALPDAAAQVHDQQLRGAGGGRESRRHGRQVREGRAGSERALRKTRRDSRNPAILPLEPALAVVYSRVTARNREKMFAVRCQKNRVSGNVYREGESRLLTEREVRRSLEGIMVAGPVEGQREGVDETGAVPPRLLVPGPSVMVALAGVFRRVSPKELAARSGLRYKKVLVFLGGAVQGEALKLLRGLKLRPAEVRILGSCIKAWSDLDTRYFSDDELDLIELEAAEAAERRRAEVKLALRGGGAAAQVRDIASERARAEEMREGLAGLKRHGQRAALVKALGRYHNWAFAVACSEHSLRQASKDSRLATEWAELGCLAAEAAGGDRSGLTSEALRGWCGSHLANAFRVQGDLPASDTEMKLCLDLWESGSDAAGLLDPGRVYELAASLRVNQRRPEKALELLERAAPITWTPAHLVIQRGLILSVVGKYEEAASIFSDAESLVAAEGDLRLENGRKFNLSFCLVHLGRYDEAAVYLPVFRRDAASLGNVLDLHRATWLEGRVLRGRGERLKALEALATAATAFESLEIDYDAALARFEEATLHLELGQPGRAAEIAGELIARFEAQGVHDEAAKAIKLFKEAILTERITAELARSILNYLYLAQHQALAFQCEL